MTSMANFAYLIRQADTRTNIAWEKRHIGAFSKYINKVVTSVNREVQSDTFDGPQLVKAVRGYYGALTFQV